MVLPTSTVDSILQRGCVTVRLPFVYFNRTAASVEADAVVVDPSSGVEALARAVADGGHRRAAAIFGPRNTSTGEEREQAVRGAFEEVGIAIARRHVLHGPFDFETGFQGARELLRRKDADSTSGVRQRRGGARCSERRRGAGIDVPGEVSIVGFDDLPTSGWALVRLSTVAYDLEAMSARPARLIVRRVEAGPDEPVRRVQFDTRWVPAQRSARRPSDDSGSAPGRRLPSSVHTHTVAMCRRAGRSPPVALRPRKCVHAPRSHGLPTLRRPRRVHP